MTTGHETMTDVLAAHQQKVGVRDMRSHCWCGWAGEPTVRAFIEHQAAALSAAGFGPVQPSEPPTVRHVDLITGETGVLDEVIARNADVHLEAMADNHWWLLVTAGGKSVHVNFGTKRAKISGHAEIEDAEP